MQHILKYISDYTGDIMKSKTSNYEKKTFIVIFIVKKVGFSEMKLFHYYYVFFFKIIYLNANTYLNARKSYFSSNHFFLKDNIWKYMV